MGKVDDVRALKATGDYPAAWFKGYTKMDADALDALLAKIADADAPPFIAEEGDTTEDGAEIPAGAIITEVPDRGVPDGFPITSDGYPVTVQVQATKTVSFQGRPRTFRRAELLRGEVAWELWENHRILVAPKA